jgi:aminodeoxyfutalosine deaminase
MSDLANPASAENLPPDASKPPADLSLLIDGLFAHLWMVRTFVKHAPETEDFPELMQVVRAIFDASRAVEAHRADPADYVRMVRKKRVKLRSALEQFKKDAPLASDHTNFKMAVRSMEAALADLDRLLEKA